MEENRISTEWARWLARTRWAHFCTVTSKRPVGRTELSKRVRDFVAAAGRVGATSIAAFVAIEPTTRGHPHAHVLLAGTAGLTIAALAARWRYGHKVIRRFKPGAGAELYIVKALEHPDADHQILGRLDRFAR